MTQVLGVLAVAVGLVLVLAPFVLLARRVRRSGVGARLMGPLDEIYNVGALRTRREQQQQELRLAPRTPSGGRRPPLTDGPEVDRR
jgi:hypothetical protein